MTTLQELKTQDMMINMGPHHPATHGVLHLKLKLSGEYVKNLEPVIGYLHRGLEKQAEQRNYFNYQVSVDRVDYLGGVFNNEAFSLAVENISKLEIPERAKYLRLIFAELNRITSHTLWMASCLIDMGALMGFPFYPFRERDKILNFLEELSGQRMMFNFTRIGGVKNNPSESLLKKIHEFCSGELPERIQEYENIATNNPIFISRMKNIGFLPSDIALDHNVTGANLRASGINFDLRKARDYSVYSKLNFSAIVSHECDCYARYLCRVKEMYESAKLVTQAIENIPDGEIQAKKIMPNLKVPKGESFGAVESPRGLLGVHVTSDGSSTPYRVRWHSPSFNNLSVLSYLVTKNNHKLSDIMACIASLDIIMPDVDR